ncbi:MAG: Ig-like domain-containing protein [Nocardioides sp.]
MRTTRVDATIRTPQVRRRRLLVMILALLMLTPAAVLLGSTSASAAATFPPRYERTIGGDGRPGVFSWGVQYNPVSDEVLVGDYLNFKIRRYDRDGNYLGDFWRDDHVGQPYTIAVDPADGSIYVAELKDNPLTVAIAKYDVEGNFLSSLPVRLSVRTRGEPPTTPQSTLRAFYTVWMTVEEDTGDLLVLDSHYDITDDYRPYVIRMDWLDPEPGDTSAEVMIEDWWELDPPTLPDPCNNPGTCVPRAYGIDISDDDVVWLTDAQNQVGYRYTKDGTFLGDFGAGQLGGDNRGVVVNEDRDRVYVVDAQNSEIDVFNQEGDYLDSFSGEGSGPGEFAGGGRAIDIDVDGDIWVGDFGGYETEKFSPTGTPLLSAPQPARKPQPGLLGQPRDVAVDDVTGEVWVADTWNQRMVRFSETGEPLGAYGERGSGGPFDMNYPRSIAIDPETRRIWLAQERGHHLQVYNYPSSPGAAPTYVRQVGAIGQDNITPGNFRWPVDIEFYTQPSGRRVAVIGDRMASSVKMFDADTYQEITRPVDPDPSDPENPLIPVSNHGTAIDPDTGNIYVARPSADRIEVYDQSGEPAEVALDSEGEPTNRIGNGTGSGPGQMRDPVDAVISEGVLYVTDETTSRVSAFSLDGEYLGRWGSTYGPNIYDFRGAIGIDADAEGRLYVTDTGNDRIQVFNPNLGRQYEQNAPPLPSVATPAQSSNLDLEPVTFSGTATDDIAVGHVEIAVQDADTDLWWNPRNQSWEADKTFAKAAWSGSDATDVEWRWVFLGVSAEGRYLAEVRTRDHNANFGQAVVRSFAMPGAAPPPLYEPPVADNVRPKGNQSSPTQGEIVLNDAPIEISGDASDDVGVARVRVAIKDVDTGRYLADPDSSTAGSFSTSFTWQTATLSTPDQPSTDWSFSWPSPIADGCNCQTLVEVTDTSGNVNGFKPQVDFEVATSLPDPVIDPPAVVAELGGPLHAELYASGLEVAPDGTVVIADTGNNEIAKYDEDGTEVWRVGGPGAGEGEFLRPRDVSVATDGTIFVVDTENERIVRLGADGTWLGELNTPARYFLGGTFEGDLFYLADIQRKVRVFDVDGNEVDTFEEIPDTACADLFDIRDAAADSEGNVYVANYRQNAVTVFSPDGECLRSWGSTGSGDGQFRTPYGVSTAMDPVTGEELVYVVDALNRRVQVFTTEGEFVGKFGTGGEPDEPGTLTTLRRASVATDGSGDVWVADLWGWRVQRWARTETGWEHAQTLGSGMPPTTDDAVFHEPRGLAVGQDGTVTVMDSVHHQFVRMDLDGTIQGRCGSRGDGNGQYNWPRDVAIDETTGDLWTADTKKNRLQIMRPNCNWRASRGSAGDGPSQFNWPRGIAIRQSDRTAWIADTQNHRVVVWDVASRTAIGSFGTGNPGSQAGQLNRPMGIAVDENTGHVFVADTINNRIVELAADPGGTDISLVRSLAYGFDQPEAVAIDADGRIIVADTNDSEIVVLDADRTWLVSFGADEGLDHPAGLATMPTGEILVSDSFNDRVLVFSDDADWEPPVADTEAPNGLATTPTQDEVFTESPITFTGSATDDVGVDEVLISLRRRSDRLWWSGTEWAAARTTFPATLTQAGATETDWSFDWEPPAEGDYAVQVSAVDAAGNVDQSKPYLRFSHATGPVDTVAPNGTLAAPSPGAVRPLEPLTFSGSATDDVSVSAVRIAIRDPANSQWWNGTDWQAGFATSLATLSDPDAAATDWSFTWTPPSTGAYAVQVIAVDASDNTDPTKPWRRFTIQ